MEKEPKTTEVKTYTEEEVKSNFVAKEEFDGLMTEYKKVVGAFNKLLKEYNELHIQKLLAEDEAK